MKPFIITPQTKVSTIDLSYLEAFGMINAGSRAIALASITLVEVDAQNQTAEVTSGTKVIKLNWEEYQKFEKSMKDLAYNIRVSQATAGNVVRGQ